MDEKQSETLYALDKSFNNLPMLHSRKSCRHRRSVLSSLNIALLSLVLLYTIWRLTPGWHPPTIDDVQILRHVQPVEVPHSALISKTNKTSKVPLEAHIMSKCPDAKACLRDLIVPTMEKMADKVDVRLSFIGTYVVPYLVPSLTCAT